jgi:hypothetical protein
MLKFIIISAAVVVALIIYLIYIFGIKGGKTVEDDCTKNLANLMKDRLR